MKPNLFIGSSVEGLKIAEAIQENLDFDFNVTLWPDGVFNIGNTALDDLLQELDKNDFGIFVFTADDITKIRGEEYRTVRDNVLFELGLYTGKFGRYNTFIITPSDTTDFHLPSDLLGVSVGKFSADKVNDNIASSVSVFCSKIKKQVINNSKNVFNGKWKFMWEIKNSETYPEPIIEEVSIFHYGNKIKFFHNVHEDEKYIVKATFNNSFLKGTFERINGIGYDGSFQAKLHGRGNQFYGKWIGWNNKGEIKSGPFSLEKN